MDALFKPVITVFYCINSMDDPGNLPSDLDGAEIKFVSMACSSMVKDVFLLRAFEAGSDAVIVLVCPEGHCRYVEGNIRAKKRVAWVKNVLDEIGIDGRRLSLQNVSAKGGDRVMQIIRDVCGTLKKLGPNPAA